jgi:hypothetical protein
VMSGAAFSSPVAAICNIDSAGCDEYRCRSGGSPGSTGTRSVNSDRCPILVPTGTNASYLGRHTSSSTVWMHTLTVVRDIILLALRRDNLYWMHQSLPKVHRRGKFRGTGRTSTSECRITFSF